MSQKLPAKSASISATAIDSAIAKVSVVIGIRQSRDRPDCIERLDNVLGWLGRNNFCHVVVVDSTHTFRPKRFRLWTVCKRHKATYYHWPLSIHSPSRIRNAGFQVCRHAPTTHVLFLDVDVLGQTGSLECLARHVQEKREFEWYPVIFTASDSGLDTMTAFVAEDAEVYRGKIYQTGYATGIQLVSKKFWPEVGGYDEEFVGYGCEDIDMIHRATGLLGQRKTFSSDDKYFEDHRTVDLEDYRGYRLWMFKKKRHVPLEQMWVHFYHPRRAGSVYWGARKANDKLLERKLREFDVTRA